MDVGLMNAIIVAHPDDETLWAGGLPIHFSDRSWQVIVCSIPRHDPQRIGRFKAACDYLGAQYTYLPVTETGPGEDLNGLDQLDLRPFDCLITHNEFGEYGHSHHKHVHRFVKSRAEGKKLITFGYRDGGVGAHELQLTAAELEKKMRALKCYNHVSPTDGRPKWEALIDVYCKGKGVKLALETYDYVSDQPQS